MKEIKLFFTKEDGVLKGSRGIKEAIDGLFDGRYVLSIKKQKRTRSLPQNAFYHGIVVNCVKDGLVGNGFNSCELSNEIVHEMLKSKFLKQDLASESGEFVTIVRSTASLSTTQFMDYIAEIQQWASEFLNIYIPEPGEQGDFSF